MEIVIRIEVHVLNAQPIGCLHSQSQDGDGCVQESLWISLGCTEFGKSPLEWFSLFRNSCIREHASRYIHNT